MLYRVKDKISQKSECSLLIVTDSSLLLCQDTKLLLIDGRGPSNWQFTASIRYVKVTYLNHKEVLLLGLSNGQV